MARARKNTAVIPPRKTRGTKTTMGVRVDPISAGVSSWIALLAAWAGDCPMERWTVIFSTMTIASSITTPIDAASPPSVIKLKLMLKSFIKTMAISVAIGMTREVTTVVRQFLRKTTSTATESRKPMTMLSVTPDIESRTSIDWS